jgi:hypothetical protein
MRGLFGAAGAGGQCVPAALIRRLRGGGRSPSPLARGQATSLSQGLARTIRGF